MATLITQVDRQTGNYEQVFIYTINASFNGVEGDINSAEIRVFIPDYLNVFLGDVQLPVRSANEISVSGGREVVYDFGSITDLGIAVRLGFGVTFKTEAIDGTTFSCTPRMIINGVEQIVSQSDVISLQLIPQFEISRQIVLPAAPPSYGSAVFYKLTLQNFGDVGAQISNVQITCSGSDEVSIDTAYPVVGADVSTKFADETADGIEATFAGNQLIFSIPSYKGEIYEFIYRAVIDENLEVGSEVSTVANWSINGQQQDEELHEVSLAEPIYDAAISLYAPDYSLPDEYICYRMGIQNTGNQILFGSVFENDLPPEVGYYQLSTGSFHIGAIKQDLSAEYFIDYETQNGLSGQLGPYNTDINSVVDLNAVIPQGDNLSMLYWRLQTLGIGVQSKASPQLLGRVGSDVSIDSSVINHIHLTFEEQGATSERVQNATTLIANYCTLRPTLQFSVSSNPIRPNEVVRVTFDANCRNSRLQNPILAFLMPPELEYVGDEQYIYSDIFTDTQPPNPPVKIIPNFAGGGQTLVKFEFVGENAFEFRQLAGVKIKFDVRVAVGAYGQISSFLLMNTQGSTGVIPGAVDVYFDSQNIAEDQSVSTNYAKSSTITNSILYFVSTSSNKKVKGLLDSEYMEEPAVGSTTDGGSLEYLITVKNIGNANLNQVEIVDILPYIGDTGVIETTTPRSSEYPIYALSEVVALIMPSEQTVEFDILYSGSTDPVRFGGSFDMIGAVDDWQSEPPEDLSLLRAFKVRSKGAILYPGQTLKVAVTASIPPGVTPLSVAWNSFATDVTYTDLSGEEKHLLAVEPEKVGVQMVQAEPNMGRIAGYSWVDENGDGYHTQDEAFVNDVLAVLYDSEGNRLRYTSTRTDAQGRDGQYVFENLPLGRYYVKFFIDDKHLKFTTQRLGEENGSKVGRSNGVTPLLDLTTQNRMEDINVGIMPKDKHTLDEIMRINSQARGVLRDVVKSQMLLTMKQEDVLEILQRD